MKKSSSFPGYLSAILWIIVCLSAGLFFASSFS